MGVRGCCVGCLGLLGAFALIGSFVILPWSTWNPAAISPYGSDLFIFQKSGEIGVSWPVYGIQFGVTLIAGAIFIVNLCGI